MSCFLFINERKTNHGNLNCKDLQTTATIDTELLLNNVMGDKSRYFQYKPLTYHCTVRNEDKIQTNKQKYKSKRLKG